MKKKIRFSKKDNNVEVKYSLYHALERSEWEVWVTKTNYYQNGSGGANTYCVFKGTEKECKRKLEELQNV